MARQARLPGWAASRQPHSGKTRGRGGEGEGRGSWETDSSILGPLLLCQQVDLKPHPPPTLYIDQMISTALLWPGSNLPTEYMILSMRLPLPEQRFHPSYLTPALFCWWRFWCEHSKMECTRLFGLGRSEPANSKLYQLLEVRKRACLLATHHLNQNTFIKEEEEAFCW